MKTLFAFTLISYSITTFAFPWLAKVETTTCKGQGMEYVTVWDGSYGVGYKSVKLNGQDAQPVTMKGDFDAKTTEYGMILKDTQKSFTILIPDGKKNASLTIDDKKYDLICSVKSKYKVFNLKDEDKAKIEHVNDSERGPKDAPDKNDLKMKSKNSASKQ